MNTITVPAWMLALLMIGSGLLSGFVVCWFFWLSDSVGR
jgi:hypothetical protein